ncbi:hypothetical protein ID866_1092 [Astraeus odoratus]|nr:hypothetical protein ID866_1092 [Astraeus odoratus]
MPQRDGNSDSSYDIVQVPVPPRPRRHPRAPTTVQIVADDFDAVTQDDDPENGETEIYPFDGVTEVRTMKGGLVEEVEPRFSGVYGEWAEKCEVNYRQAPTSADYGRYMDEVSRRLQEIAVDSRSQGQSTVTRLRRDAEPLPMQPGREGERGGRVHMWREEVARNGGGLSEFGESTSQASSAMHSRSKMDGTDPGTLKPREIQNMKTTLRRSQSSASQSYRSERMYTSSDLNEFYPLKNSQRIAGKSEKRVKSPSPTRSERIYTMAELSALTGQKSSPPRRNALTGYGKYYNRSASSTSPQQNIRADPRMSPPIAVRTRSTSTTSVEMVLASCQPSLLHIAPVLYGLGIKQREHLRALARLREETRDREMKEEMLKKGVTVLEWAILMDKLQGF